MKKVLFSIIAAAILVLPSCAATTYNASNRVSTVGSTLLTKNGISSTNVKFMVVSGTADNSSYSTNKTINVSTNDLTYAGNDNEVAAVVASELGHIISGHSAKSKVMSLVTSNTNLSSGNDTASSLVSSYQTLKQDEEADNIAVELMVNAGYNPLAMIVVLTKQTGSYWETLQGKPANAERAMSAYDYISYAYPAKVKAGYGCNEYKNFLTYADTVTAEREANSKLAKKNTKTQTKAKKNSTSKISKFKTRGGLSGWDAAYGLLNATD